MTRIPKAVAVRVVLKAYDSADHISAKTGATIAIVISKNGGAFGNPNAGATNATQIANGWYYVDLDTTDTGTEGPLIVRGTASGADDIEQVFQVVKATNGGWTGIPDAAADAPGGLPISDAGGLDLDALATGEIAILARLSTIATKTGAAVADASNTAVTFKTTLTESTDDFYKDGLIKMTSGTLKEQVKRIRGYNGTTKFVTVANGFTSAPADTDTFEIVND